MLLNTFFVVLSLALEGFDRQASVHFSLTSNVDKSQQHHKTYLGTPRIKPGAAGWETRMLTLCYAAPLLTICKWTLSFSRGKRKTCPQMLVLVAKVSKLALRICSSGYPCCNHICGFRNLYCSPWGQCVPIIGKPWLMREDEYQHREDKSLRLRLEGCRIKSPVVTKVSSLKISVKCLDTIIFS